MAKRIRPPASALTASPTIRPRSGRPVDGESAKLQLNRPNSRGAGAEGARRRRPRRCYAKAPKFGAKAGGLQPVDPPIEDGFVDILAAGCDAGVCYDERLELDMMAMSAPGYLDRRGRPGHPRDLLQQACLRHRFANRRPALDWGFVLDGEKVKVSPPSSLVVQTGGADLTVQAAFAGAGVIQLFNDWLRLHFESRGLEPAVEPWWSRLPSPFLYYPGRRLTPPFAVRFPSTMCNTSRLWRELTPSSSGELWSSRALQVQLRTDFLSKTDGKSWR